MSNHCVPISINGRRRRRRKMMTQLSTNSSFLLFIIIFILCVSFFAQLASASEDGSMREEHLDSTSGKHIEAKNDLHKSSDSLIFEGTLDENKRGGVCPSISRVKFNLNIKSSEQCGLLDFVEDLLSKEEDKEEKQDEGSKTEKPPRTLYLGLNEFRNQRMNDKGKDDDDKLLNITHRLESDGSEYNYAASSKGAKVLAHNKEANGAVNILSNDKDKYLRNPCSAEEKFVVIELSEETLVDAVEIANFEHHSSNLKEFELLGSLVYPTDSWFSLGKYIAVNVKHAQRFTLQEPKWIRYLKLNLLSHFGTGFYCTVSSVQVYGMDVVDRMLQDLIAVPDEALSATKAPNSSASSQRENRTHIQTISKITSLSEDSHMEQKTIEQVSKLDPLNHEVDGDKIPDPVKEIRQHPTGRVPSGTVLKLLMQKVRSLELNLAVLEGYLQELSERYAKVFPDFEKELSQTALLMEQARSEIKEIKEWKQALNKSFADITSWKSRLASQLDALVGDNNLLRMKVEEISGDLATLYNKELVVLAVSFLFGCFSLLNLVLFRISQLFWTSECKIENRSNSQHLLILFSSCIIIIIVLL